MTDATLWGGTGWGAPDPQRLVWQLAATAGLIAMAVVTRSTDLGVHDNRAQLARIAYVLDQTGVGDSVYDPLGTASFARVRVGRGDVGQAALAIIPNSALAADRDLRALVESNFEPTRFPDVWRASLRWTTPPVLFEPSQSFVSDALPVVSPVVSP